MNVSEALKARNAARDALQSHPLTDEIRELAKQMKTCSGPARAKIVAERDKLIAQRAADVDMVGPQAKLSKARKIEREMERAAMADELGSMDMDELVSALHSETARMRAAKEKRSAIRFAMRRVTSGEVRKEIVSKLNTEEKRKLKAELEAELLEE